MNRFILDTNIVLAYFMKKQEIISQIEKDSPLFTNENITALSIVFIGELYSLALQRQWSEKKITKISKLIRELVLCPKSFI